MSNTRKNKLLHIKTSRFIIYFIMILVSVTLLFPIIFMITNSFMSAGEIEKAYSAVADSSLLEQRGDVLKFVSFELIPEKITLIEYYHVLLRRPDFLLKFWNSVLLTAPIVLGQLLVASLAAYGFSKLKYPLSSKIFFIYIIAMIMPFQVTLVPNYIILRKLHLIGSSLAVILPGIFSTFGVFLLRQFMILIPDEYCEAAKIDGSGYLKTFTGIILPQCKGALAALAILVFIDNWNMVEQPLILLNDERLHPLSIFLSKLNAFDIGISFACGVLYMTPAILIFFYGENYFIEGIELSGIK